MTEVCCLIVESVFQKCFILRNKMYALHKINHPTSGTRGELCASFAGGPFLRKLPWNNFIVEMFRQIPVWSSFPREQDLFPIATARNCCATEGLLPSMLAAGTSGCRNLSRPVGPQSVHDFLSHTMRLSTRKKNTCSDTNMVKVTLQYLVGPTCVTSNNPLDLARFGSKARREDSRNKVRIVHNPRVTRIALSIRGPGVFPCAFRVWLPLICISFLVLRLYVSVDGLLIGYRPSRGAAVFHLPGCQVKLASSLPL